MTYHLWAYRKEDRVPRSPKLTFDGNVRLQSLLLRRILESFFKKVSTGYRFVLALDHSYSEGTLSQSSLRGRDVVLYEVLMDTLAGSEFMEGRLELLSVKQFSKPQDTTKYIHLDLLKEDEDDDELKGDYVLSRRTIWINQERFLAMEHESSDYEYDTGNEGYRTAFKYDHACVMIQHPGFGEW